MLNNEFNPSDVIGKKYHRGLLPFGGSVNSKGIIVEAISREEFDEQMERLRDL